LHQLDNEFSSEKHVQESIYKGTLDFLISENLIKNIPHDVYRLTSKSFAHLNKTFKEGKVESEESSYIVAIKKLFTHTSSMSKKVAVGVAIHMIPKLLGDI
jgi:hypothetical protein